MNDTLESSLNEVFGEDAWFEPSKSGSSGLPEGEYDAKVWKPMLENYDPNKVNLFWNVAGNL